MAYAAIAFIAPNFRDYKNEWIKAYEPGTTTPKAMATDSTLGTLIAKAQLNADGFIVSASGALIIPYIDGSYDLWLFPSEAEADTNDTSNALRLADNVNALNTSIINDLSQAYEFATVALMTADETVFPTGKKLVTTTNNVTSNSGGANYIVTAGISPDVQKSPALTGGGYAKLQESDGGTVKQYGDTGAGSASDKLAIQSQLNSGKRILDTNSSSTIATSVGQIAKFDMNEFTWPLNSTVDYQGATGEMASLINYISEAYQVLPVITDPWLALTGYSIGQKRINGAQAYKVTASGTSAASGGPTGTGTGIVDGTVTWESINNGLFSGVPVNERRIHAPYHPGLILDWKSPASYGGVNQPAHDFMDAFTAAGGDTTGEYRSIVWSVDGAADWQMVADNVTDSMSIHKLNAGQLWRQYFNAANGDIQIQSHDTFGLADSKPLDVAGGIRVFTDTFVDGTVRSDNKARFITPEFSLRYRDNLGGDNEHKMSLGGTNGYQWLFDAADSTGLNGQAESSMRWNVYKSDGTLRSLSFSGFYGSFEPVTTNTTSLGRTGKVFKELHVTDIRPGTGVATWSSGAGTPEGTVTGAVGSMWTRTDGGAGTTLYIKESGAGNTGWVAK